MLPALVRAPGTYLFERLVKPGMTVIDVGANWGYFSLIAAKLAGSSGRVISIEPDPRMYIALQENLLENNIANATTLPCAAAAEECTLTLEPFDAGSSNWGISRLILDGTSASGKEVQCHSLDRLLDRQRVNSADLTKIDVEGAEEEVLAGMRYGLSTHRYRRILLELHPTILHEPDRAIQRILSSLTLHGYTGYWIDHSAPVTRRMAYARHVELADVILPLEAKSNCDSWPHMMWLAPGVTL